MTVASLIADVNDSFRGDEPAPTQGTEEYNYWLRVARRKLFELFSDDKQNWDFVELDDEGIPEVPPLTRANEEIEIPIPAWLTYAVASELAFNDLTHDDKFPDLQNKANYFYSQMAHNNNRKTKTVPTQVNRIRGVS